MYNPPSLHAQSRLKRRKTVECIYSDEMFSLLLIVPTFIRIHLCTAFTILLRFGFQFIYFLSFFVKLIIYLLHQHLIDSNKTKTKTKKIPMIQMPY